MGLSRLFRHICFGLCNHLCLLAHLNKIWFLGILVHQTFYLPFFLCMLARGSVGLKMASEKPLLVVCFFRIFRLGLPFVFCTANGFGPFRKANRRAQQAGGTRLIELWAR